MSPAFGGYPLPISNTTYTPNQFFDVVLPHSSRGCVRLVSYMLRRTLGWSDKDGNPLEEQVSFSYSELVEKAGISRGMIRSALDEAEQKYFIRCLKEGSPNELGQLGRSALYELAFDDSGRYTTHLSDFHGFFAGNGNRTYIPNAFFDHTVREEPLAVVRAVGAVIRSTIGFHNKFGHRRQEVRLSFSDLQRLTRLGSRRALSEAIQIAISHNHITRLEDGYFDSQAGRNSEKGLYGLRWETKEAVLAPDGPGSTVLTVEDDLNGSKRIPGKIERRTLMSKRTVRKGYREESEKDTGDGSKRIPGERFEKDTGIKITTKIKPLNKIPKQQQVRTADSLRRLSPAGPSGAAKYRAKQKSEVNCRPSARVNGSSNTTTAKGNRPVKSAAADDVSVAGATEEDLRALLKRSIQLAETKKAETRAPINPINAFSAYQRLKREGFDRHIAGKLALSHPAQVVLNQCGWIRSRNASKNKLGLLRRSIEENWAKPEAPVDEPQTLGERFVSHFYAAWAGNSGEPVAEGSAEEAKLAERFIWRLGGETSEKEAIALARDFGSFVRLAERATSPLPRSFKLALRHFGDGFTRSGPTLVKTAKSEPQPRPAEEKRAVQLEDLPEVERQAFFEFEEAEREKIRSMPMVSKETIAAVLDRFDLQQNKKRRLSEWLSSSTLAPRQANK